MKVKAIVPYSKLRDGVSLMNTLSIELEKQGIKIRPSLDIYATPHVESPFCAYSDFATDSFVVEQVQS